MVRRRQVATMIHVSTRRERGATSLSEPKDKSCATTRREYEANGMFGNVLWLGKSLGYE